MGNSLGIVLFWSQLLHSVVSECSNSQNCRPVVVVPLVCCRNEKLKALNCNTETDIRE